MPVGAMALTRTSADALAGDIIAAGATRPG
jgi:hypothetical protein